MSDSLIIAAARSLDQQGDLAPVYQLIQQIEADNQRSVVLTIDDLNTPWHSPVQPNHFRSGIGPIQALAVAHLRSPGNQRSRISLPEGSYFQQPETNGSTASA